MKTLERLIENTILASRWILVVFYFGLSAALLIYSLSFIKKLIETAAKVMTFGEAEAVLAMLGLIDAALVGSLIVMVMISGYENFVSRFDQADESKLSWLGKLDAGTLKVKVASTIVAISSIHLLQVFLNAAQYENSEDHVADDHAYGVRVLGSVPRPPRSHHDGTEEACRVGQAHLKSALPSPSRAVSSE